MEKLSLPKTSFLTNGLYKATKMKTKQLQVVANNSDKETIHQFETVILSLQPEECDE